MYSLNMLEDILLNVEKPARYLGNEWNVVVKDFDKTLIRFALCFPDLYDVGMSNLGLRILYGLLNNLDDVLCERVFSPGFDLEQILRNRKLNIFSLESKRNLNDFDIIGFSLGYELTYTNVLNLLDLAGIPQRSQLRNDRYPLVIAGGGCCLNPEPMADFIDLFLIGEAEEAILEIIDIYRKLKRENHDRKPRKQNCLNQLKYIRGVYIPSLYDASYKRDGTISRFFTEVKDAPLIIEKRYLKDLDSGFYPVDWLLPYTEIIHDHIPLEVMRGCPNRCRFCQSRSSYFPYRYRTHQRIIDLAKSIYCLTGYEEISLMGLSISDYHKPQELLRSLIDIFKERKVGVSFSSMRAKPIVKYLIPLVTEIKKTGLTFAPEAASQRLRKILDKDFDCEAFFSVIEEAYKLGYQHVKLYFMIGLPDERDEDLDGIIDLSAEVLKLNRKVDHGSGWVNVSVATLIPKPHTPFQWFSMEEIDGIKRKQEYLRSRVKYLAARDSSLRGRIKISFHNRYMSFIECLLSRGDRRLAQVILRAWQKGARFDAWDGYFSFDLWMEALRESNIDPDFYVHRRYLQGEVLPWDFIDTGIPKENLWSELERIGI